MVNYKWLIVNDGVLFLNIRNKFKNDSFNH